MFTRIGNLLLASWFLLMVIWPENWRWAGSPPPIPHSPLTFREIVITAAICVWFLSALGLFFRSRLMWLVSLVGVGAATFVSAWISIHMIRDFLFQSSADAQPKAEGIIGIVANILAVVTIIGFCAVWFSFSLGLFIGLVKMRKQVRWI
jgi:hypothetical protein